MSTRQASEPAQTGSAVETAETETERKRLHRPVRSFVLRQGRLTRGQQRALDELWPRYGLSPQQGGSPDQWFGRMADCVLEIGFGNGRALLESARSDPARDYLGIEVHGPGVGQLLLGIEALGLGNVRVFQHDAVEILRQVLPERCLAEARIWFPDPWHKKRHHKRRLIQPAFIELLTSRMRPGALLHLATDWAPYAEWMIEVCEACPRLRNLAGAGQHSPRPASRPLTHFEQRGERLGHALADLLYEVLPQQARD